jgi:hypothetical protein
MTLGGISEADFIDFWRTSEEFIVRGNNPAEDEMGIRICPIAQARFIEDKIYLLVGRWVEFSCTL